MPRKKDQFILSFSLLWLHRLLLPVTLKWQGGAGCVSRLTVHMGKRLSYWQLPLRSRGMLVSFQSGSKWETIIYHGPRGQGLSAAHAPSGHAQCTLCPDRGSRWEGWKETLSGQGLQGKGQGLSPSGGQAFHRNLTVKRGIWVLSKTPSEGSPTELRFPYMGLWFPSSRDLSSSCTQPGT